MAKGDDALAKKKNKAIRKRNRRAGAGTTDAIEGVQSHKRRRKAGTRRVCEVHIAHNPCSFSSSQISW